jgi:hypothetical protein
MNDRLERAIARVEWLRANGYANARIPFLAAKVAGDDRKLRSAICRTFGRRGALKRREVNSGHQVL